MDSSVLYDPDMDIATRIATNLGAWMAETPALSTLKKVSEKSCVGFGTVRRARNGDGNITAANLEAIASAFGRRAADLLQEPRATETAPTYAVGNSELRTGFESDTNVSVKTKRALAAVQAVLDLAEITLEDLMEAQRAAKQAPTANGGRVSQTSDPGATLRARLEDKKKPAQ